WSKARERNSRERISRGRWIDSCRAIHWRIWASSRSPAGRSGGSGGGAAPRPPKSPAPLTHVPRRTSVGGPTVRGVRGRDLVRALREVEVVARPAEAFLGEHDADLLRAVRQPVVIQVQAHEPARLLTDGWAHDFHASPPLERRLDGEAVPQRTHVVCTDPVDS